MGRSVNLNEKITKVAYDLYTKRGMIDGYDFDDWLKAEKIVKEQYEKAKKHEKADITNLINKKVVTKRKTKNRSAVNKF